MPHKLKMPILTFFVPSFCANCKTPYSESNFKFTLVGTEDRCAWLCNRCFVRLHSAEMNKQKKSLIKVTLNPTPEILEMENCVEEAARNNKRREARDVGRAVTDGKTLMEHIDRGEEQ